MKETSVFQIGFDFDLSRLKDLPGEIDKILKEIDSSVSSLGEKISKGTVAKVTEIQISLQAARREVLKQLGIILATIGIDRFLDQYGNVILDFFRRQPTELEKLDKLKREVRSLIDQARDALREVERFGENPNIVDQTGLPQVKTVILERLNSLNTLLEEIVKLEDELTSKIPKLKAGIPEQPGPIDIPFVLPIPVHFGGVTIPPQRPDFIGPLEEELEKILEGNEAIEERSQILKVLKNATASTSSTISDAVNPLQAHKDALEASKNTSIELVNNGLDPLVEKTGELTNNFEVVEGRVTQAKETLGSLEGTMGNVASETSSLNDNVVELSDKNKDLADTQGQVNQVVGESGSEFQNAGAGVKEYGDALEKVEGTGGGFFQGIKDGFGEFVESVQSNSELAANFFADTLSAMSQNFSDLFFNVITGKFDDLKDLAKQAFDAILRSFLDLVAAIATRQIVISIAGAFGASTKGASAFDVVTGGAKAAGDSEREEIVNEMCIQTKMEQQEYKLAA